MSGRIVERTEVQKARKRLGLTPIDQARWLLEFIALDLDVEDPSAGQWLDLGWDVATFGLPENATPNGPWDAEAVLGFRAELLEGMEKVLKGERWELEDVTTYSLTRGPWLGRDRLLFSWRGEATYRLIQAMRCLSAADDAGHIRKCARPGCGRLFVPIRRQTFCGETCSRRVRFQRYLKRHPRAERSDLRHKAYAERIRTQSGEKVKVSRRAVVS